MLVRYTGPRRFRNGKVHPLRQWPTQVYLIRARSQFFPPPPITHHYCWVVLCAGLGFVQLRESNLLQFRYRKGEGVGRSNSIMGWYRSDNFIFQVYRAQTTARRSTVVIQMTNKIKRFRCIRTPQLCTGIHILQYNINTPHRGSNLGCVCEQRCRQVVKYQYNNNIIIIIVLVWGDRTRALSITY